MSQTEAIVLDADAQGADLFDGLDAHEALLARVGEVREEWGRRADDLTRRRADLDETTEADRSRVREALLDVARALVKGRSATGKTPRPGKEPELVAAIATVLETEAERSRVKEEDGRRIETVGAALRDDREAVAIAWALSSKIEGIADDCRRLVALTDRPGRARVRPVVTNEAHAALAPILSSVIESRRTTANGSDSRLLAIADFKAAGLDVDRYVAELDPDKFRIDLVEPVDPLSARVARWTAAASDYVADRPEEN